MQGVFKSPEKHFGAEIPAIIFMLYYEGSGVFNVMNGKVNDRARVSRFYSKAGTCWIASIEVFFILSDQLGYMILSHAVDIPKINNTKK